VPACIAPTHLWWKKRVRPAYQRPGRPNFLRAEWPGSAAFARICQDRQPAEFERSSAAAGWPGNGVRSLAGGQSDPESLRNCAPRLAWPSIRPTYR